MDLLQKIRPVLRAIRRKGHRYMGAGVIEEKEEKEEATRFSVVY